MSSEKPTVHYFASTHWDREWYEPFQGFRMRLVDVLDGVLERLEADPAYACFHMDGQTIPLDDYLEIRPEHAGRLRKQVEAGRLLLGPWYVQPDLMLVGGEGLIRNLMLGDREARRHGGQPLKFGYMCDMFGHPGVMPQILNGFGIGAALLGRGTNEHTHPAHFRWAGADGSELLVYKLQDDGGYGSWHYSVRRFVGEQAEDEALLIDKAGQFIRSELARDHNVPHVLVMDGLDHLPVWPAATRALALLREKLPQYEWVHDSLSDYAAAMAEHRKTMPIVRGELRRTAKQKSGHLWLISNTLSSRLPLKQANDAMLTLLCRWAEPFMLWANLDGAGIPATYLPRAWRYLLQNHPHDSICGCSIDQVHKDMEYRFDQCRLIAQGVLNRALGRFGGGRSRKADEVDRLELRVFNPQPYAERRSVQLELEMPEWPTRFREGFGYLVKNAFTLTDAQGRSVPYQLVRLDAGVGRRAIGANDPGRPMDDLYTLAVTLDLLPMGFTTLTVHPTEGFTRIGGGMRTGPRSAANEHVAIELDDLGRLNLTCKRTGRTYAGLLELEDAGEIGDGWFHWAPVNERQIVGGGSATVSCLHDGPIQTSFQIDRRLTIPAAMNWHTLSRDEATVELRVRHTVTLRAGDAHVEVTTRVENNARDHRLRLLLPTGVTGREYFADEPFGLVRRAVGADASTADWKEPDVAERSMWSLAGLADNGGGLAFISGGGLKEVAALGDEAGTLAVTLFRSYVRTVNTAGEPGGQLQGPLEVRYVLAPLPAGPVDAAELMRLRDRLQTGLRTVRRVVRKDEPAADLPQSASFCELDNPAVLLSALKAAEDGDGLIVRLYNPSAAALETLVRFARPVASAELTNLNEEEQAPAVCEGQAVRVDVAAHKIVTVRARLAGQ